MAYGVTSSTLLLIAGITPAAASASVHLAEVGTTLASGVSHWRFGNVDWRVVTQIALPGAVGAFAGATLLSSISTESAVPWIAGILLALGATCWSASPGRCGPTGRRGRGSFLGPLGLVAGFIDATGGGGWGPVATPALLASGSWSPARSSARWTPPSSSSPVAASIGFLIGLGCEDLLPTVAALLIGGVIAAPLAAWLVRLVPAQLLGAAVGGLIVLTNARILLRYSDTRSAVSSVAARCSRWGGRGPDAGRPRAAATARPTPSSTPPPEPGPARRRRRCHLPAGTPHRRAPRLPPSPGPPRPAPPTASSTRPRRPALHQRALRQRALRGPAPPDGTASTGGDPARADDPLAVVER